MYKLSEVEAFRARVLLMEAIKKLNFLTSVSTSASAHGAELTQFMGDEISRIIQEQRDLEKKYEELIAQRGALKGLTNKKKFIETQKEILDVSLQLKDSNKQLCRNLKENPNVEGNLQKMKNERQIVHDWLEETKNDLKDCSFANLVAKVDAERREQDRLGEVRKKEKEASQQVKQLEAERAREQAEHEKDTKASNLEIKELKEQLQINKMISEIEYKFEEKKLRAREQALLRIHQQEEKRLKEELDELQRAEETEQTVHHKAHEFFEKRMKDLNELKDYWHTEVQNELEDRKAADETLTNRREQNYQKLKELEGKRLAEAEENRKKEEEMRNAVLIYKKQCEQEIRMEKYVRFLQEEGRKYMERLQARRAAMKGGKKKKGKKGK